MGLVFYNQGNLEEAISNFQMAIRLHPNYDTAREFLRDAEQRLAEERGSR